MNLTVNNEQCTEKEVLAPGYLLATLEAQKCSSLPQRLIRHQINWKMSEIENGHHTGTNFTFFSPTRDKDLRTAKLFFHFSSIQQFCFLVCNEQKF